MRICLVNQTKLPDREVLPIISAVNLQLVEFMYHWSIIGQCRLEGRRGNAISMKELRGDALIYLQRTPQEGALGWHDADKYGVPYGVVYTEAFDEPWSVTLSHEVLELMLDPHVNRLAAGPHPTIKGRTVFHWYEACDAVQSDTYKVAGVEVSDFVLPAYFTEAEEQGMRMSYLGADLRSFGTAPGGYVGFFDPVTGRHDTYFNDERGREAAAQHGKLGRSVRYKGLMSTESS